MLKDRFMLIDGIVIDTAANTELPELEQKDIVELLNEVHRHRVFRYAMLQANAQIYVKKEGEAVNG